MTNQELENEVMSLKDKIDKYGEAIRICMDGLKEITALLSDVKQIVGEDDRNTFETVDSQRFMKNEVSYPTLDLCEVYGEKR